jgi:hypothetical protein
METLVNNIGVKNHTGNKAKHKEGPVAKAIEEQTAKVPSDVFLWTSFAVMGVALTMKIIGKDHLSLFIGQWASPLLIMGLYNKVVKVEGHDKTDK